MNTEKEFSSIVASAVIFCKNSEMLDQFDPRKIFALSKDFSLSGEESNLYPYAAEIHLTS